jgi:hypothetical protein
VPEHSWETLAAPAILLPESSLSFNNTVGGGNIGLGANAGINLTTGDNNIDIGNVGVAGESNTIRIG